MACLPLFIYWSHSIKGADISNRWKVFSKVQVIWKSWNIEHCHGKIWILTNIKNIWHIGRSILRITCFSCNLHICMACASSSPQVQESSPVQENICLRIILQPVAMPTLPSGPRWPHPPKLCTKYDKPFIWCHPDWWSGSCVDF